MMFIESKQLTYDFFLLCFFPYIFEILVIKLKEEKKKGNFITIYKWKLKSVTINTRLP